MNTPGSFSCDCFDGYEAINSTHCQGKYSMEFCMEFGGSDHTVVDPGEVLWDQRNPPFVH